MMTQLPSRRGRWALSFADLALLLLGFFVLLQASGTRKEDALRGVGAQFGAITTPNSMDLPSDTLFEPGEALLKPTGRKKLADAARTLAKDDRVLEIQSFGMEQGQHRFDAWDLAAARLGAVARALQESGIDQDRLRIAGLVEAPRESPAKHGDSNTLQIKTQTIRILSTSGRP